VERDGTVFEVFDPRFWAFHLGLAGTGGRVDRRSIGIEIASEGWLEERGGELLAIGRPFGGAVYDHGGPWRENGASANRSISHPSGQSGEEAVVFANERCGILPVAWRPEQPGRRAYRPSITSIP
jgi:hypothetical protein